MDELSNILNRRSYDAPEDITILKKYIKDKYSEDSKVRLYNDKLIVTVNSAALASTLKNNLYEIKNRLNIKKAVIIQIS